MGSATGWLDAYVTNEVGLRLPDSLLELRISMPYPSELLGCFQRIEPLLAVIKTWKRGQYFYEFLVAFIIPYPCQ